MKCANSAHSFRDLHRWGEGWACLAHIRNRVTLDCIMRDEQLRSDIMELLERRADREEQREFDDVDVAVDSDGAGERGIDRDGVVGDVKRKAIRYVLALSVPLVIATVGGFVLQQSRQLPVIGDVVPVPTWPPEVVPAPVQIVEVQAQETEADRIIMEKIRHLTTAVDNLAAEVAEQGGVAGAAQKPVETIIDDSGTGIPSGVETHPVVPVALPEPAISVWEDGTCWTPATVTVLHLCGADASDGYVIRWIGVHGDSTGPQIPDADWHAVRGTGDRLVWSGVHPATGDAVTVDYWAGGHVLAVRLAGRLLFRIDRGHGVVH